MSKIAFTHEGWEDYLYWQKSDKKILQRVNELIKDALRTPYSGIGKPEPLRYEFQGCWSRRIDKEHRLVYKIINDLLIVIAARFHYDK